MSSEKVKVPLVKEVYVKKQENGTYLYGYPVNYVIIPVLAGKSPLGREQYEFHVHPVKSGRGGVSYDIDGNLLAAERCIHDGICDTLVEAIDRIDEVGHEVEVNRAYHQGKDDGIREASSVSNTVNLVVEDSTEELNERLENLSSLMDDIYVTIGSLGGRARAMRAMRSIAVQERGVGIAIAIQELERLVHAAHNITDKYMEEAGNREESKDE